MDGDFYLFSHAASGQEAVVHRSPGGPYGLRFVGGPPDDGDEVDASLVEVDLRPAPVLTLREARAELDRAAPAWFFFRDLATGRGHVVYRRYDGHEGLIEPAGPPGASACT